MDVWAQLIMKEPADRVERILRPADRDLAPRRGRPVSFAGMSNDWHDVTHEDEAFFLRVYGEGDYRFKGADLGILVTKGRMQTSKGLTTRCRRYIDGIRAQYLSEALPSPGAVPIGYVK